MPRHLDDVEQVLYDHVERSVVGQAVLWTVSWLPPGVSGMTLGHRVLLRRGRQGDAQLVAHELVHVEQYQTLGTGAFLVGYVRAYASNLWRFRSHRLAYLAIPAEREARRRTTRWARDDRAERVVPPLA